MPDYISQPRGKSKIRHARFTIGDREINQSLQTSDKQLAVARAKKLRRELLEGRWEVLDALRIKRDVSTFADLFTAYDDYAAGADISPRSVRENKTCLARIVRAYYGEQFDPAKDRLSILTATGLRKYEAARIKAAKDAGPLAINTAHTTAHSTAQQARSLFAQDCLQSYAYRDLKLPDLAAVLAYKLKRGKTKRFQAPEKDLMAATVAAIAQLKQQHPARWMALMLAANLGLRRGEGVAAQWAWVAQIELTNGQAGYVMHVVKRTDFDPKGSERTINIPPDFWAEMLVMRTSCGHILPGSTNKRKALYADNVAWLRALGWTANKPTHEMRKLFGSAMATEHGLFAAQSALGHSDPRLTSQVYASNLDRSKVTRVF